MLYRFNGYIKILMYWHSCNNKKESLHYFETRSKREKSLNMFQKYLEKNYLIKNILNIFIVPFKRLQNHKCTKSVPVLRSTNLNSRNETRVTFVAVYRYHPSSDCDLCRNRETRNLAGG